MPTLRLTQNSLGADQYLIELAVEEPPKPRKTAKDLGLKALDKQTLEVTLEGPRGFFPILAAYTAALPAHKPSVDKFGDKWTDPGATGAPVISNGPFVLTKWEHNKSFEIQRNEKYATNNPPFL